MWIRQTRSLRSESRCAWLMSGVSLIGLACNGQTLPLEGTGGSAGEISEQGGSAVVGAGGKISTARGGSTGQSGGALGKAGSPGEGGSTSQGGAVGQGGSSGRGGSTSSGGSAAAGSLGEGGGAGAPDLDFSITEIVGEEYGCLGMGATFVGDLDQDGFDDFVVLDAGCTGPRRALDLGTRGVAYLFYGGKEQPKRLEAASANAILIGAQESVTRLGDMDGDGFPDFAFTATCGTGDPEDETCATDGIHIVYGGRQRLTGVHLSSDIGVSWKASGAGARYLNVRGLGDVNGDRLADLVVDVGVPMGNEPEQVTSYLLTGQANRADQAPARGTAEAIFRATRGDQRVTYGSAPAYDMDGDGYDDLLISSLDRDREVLTGKISLFYGGPKRLRGAVELDQADATFTWSSTWFTLGGLGDLDNDGYADLGLSVGRAQTNQLRVIHGGPTRLTGAHDQTAIDFTITTPGRIDGVGAGDVNGDGHLDIVIGDTQNGHGTLALLLGTPGRRTEDWAIDNRHIILSGESRPSDDPDDPSADGSDILGYGTAANGDVNGDGLADLLVTAVGNNSGDRDGGRAFLIKANTHQHP